MAHVSPLRNQHALAEAAFIAYGTPPGAEPKPARDAAAAERTGASGPGVTDRGAVAAIEIVETFGEIESEYAALRKGCVLLDQPQRATIETLGADRLGFLNRMLTQQLKDLTPGRTARSFWLNRKGRIDADLRVIELGDRTLFDVDVHAAARTVAGLAGYIISEDVSLAEITADWHRLALHGPSAPALLRALAGDDAERVMSPGQAARVTIAGREVIADRQDETGEPGYGLLMRVGDVQAVWQALVETGSDHDGDANGGGANGNGAHRLRPAGWHAYNIARIEAGWPLYNIDFGPESLPAESGVLRDRVSFTKGCYLGQEVVARMDALGAPKQTLAALRLEERASEIHPTAGVGTVPMQPVTGAPVFAGEGESAGEIVGAVTSSAVAPMLGGAPICFAQLRTKWSAAGTELNVSAENHRLRAVVQPGLRFWPRA